MRVCTDTEVKSDMGWLLCMYYLLPTEIEVQIQSHTIFTEQKLMCSERC